jgi:hypothetical protein
MGAVPRSGLKRLFIGNTAERVLHQLPCDLLIVKPPQLSTCVPSTCNGPHDGNQSGRFDAKVIPEDLHGPPSLTHPTTPPLQYPQGDSQGRLATGWFGLIHSATNRCLRRAAGRSRAGRFGQRADPIIFANV